MQDEVFLIVKDVNLFGEKLNDACGVYGDGDDVHDECEWKSNLNCFAADPPALPTFDDDDVCGR